MKFVLLILVGVQFSWMIKNDALKDLRRDAESIEATQFNKHIINSKSSGENKKDNVKENIHPESLKDMKKREDDGATNKKEKTNNKEGIGRKKRKERKRGKRANKNRSKVTKDKIKRLEKHKGRKRKLRNKEGKNKRGNKRDKIKKNTSLKTSRKKIKKRKRKPIKKIIRKGKKEPQIKGSKSTIKESKKRGNKRKTLKKKIIKDLKQTQKTCSCDVDKRFLTLSNKLKQARLITRTYSALESKKNKSATTFEEAAVAIKLATDAGKKCNGKLISQYPSASTAYKILQVCKSTAAASCDASKIPSIANQTFFDSCIQEFTSFSKGYQDCVRKSSCNCSCYRQLSNVSAACEDFDFLDTTKAVVKVRNVCQNPKENGSFSSCRLQQREVAYYGEKCKKCEALSVSPPYTTVQSTVSSKVNFSSTKDPDTTTYGQPVQMTTMTTDMEKDIKYLIELVKNQTQSCYQSCSTSSYPTTCTSPNTSASTITPNYNTTTTTIQVFKCLEIIIDVELKDQNGNPFTLFLVPATIIKDGQIEYNVTFDREGKLQQTISTGGNYTLDISLTGYKNLSFNFSINATDPTQCKTNYNLTMSDFKCEKIIIEVQIRNEDNDPLGNATGTIKKDGKVEYNVTFDSNGKLQKDLGSGGNYTLDVSLADYKNLSFNISIDDTDPEQCKTNYILTMTPAFICEKIIIACVLRNSDDDPLANVPATIKKDDGMDRYNVKFDRKGKLTQTLRSGGKYTIEISKTGYDDYSSTFEIDEKDPTQCKTDYTFIMVKKLVDKQTRMCMNWSPGNFGDMDLYVMSVYKLNNSTCLTSLDNKTGCNNVDQDRDNDKGGFDGPEIVTFQDRKINSNYTYIVAVEEYFASETDRDNGTNLLNSGVQIEIKSNSNYTETYKLNSPNIPVTAPNTFYLFGCLQINKNAKQPYFTFTKAPAGIFFDGSNGNEMEWLRMNSTYCR